MKVWKVIALIAPLAVVVRVAPGLAHEGHGRPCRQDIQRLCPNVTSGPGSGRACLEEHAAELSPACQQQLSQTKAKKDELQQACPNDIQQFCGDVQPGRGIMRCLHQHRDELSQTCTDQLAQCHRHHHHHAPNPAPSGGSSGE
jgi:hypothetical protein